MRLCKHCFRMRKEACGWGQGVEGFCVFRDQKMLAFTPVEGLSHENVRSLFQDTDGSIWAGTYGGGLSHFHDGVFSAYGKEEGLSSDLISWLSAILRELEVGTKSDGLNRWVDGKVKKYSTEDGLPSKQIFSLYPDPSGGLWIGTSSGLVLSTDEKFTSTPPPRVYPATWFSPSPATRMAVSGSER